LCFGYRAKHPIEIVEKLAQRLALELASDGARDE
jgi:hypothetical protein